MMDLVWEAATSALSRAERSYPTSEVRGRSWEDPMPKGRRPRGVTPHPRSGAAAECARLQRCRNSGEELPKSEVRGSGQEELPHTRGQGHRPGRPHSRRVVAKRSYPTSEVRGSSRECQAATVQEWPRGATPHPRSGAAAGRSYPTSEVRGGSREELPGVRSQWQWPRVPGCDSTGAAKRSYLTSVFLP